MNVQTASVALSDSRESSEDLGGCVGGDRSSIVYYFHGQACKLSRGGYLPVPALGVVQLVQLRCDILVSDEQRMLDSIDDTTDIYTQPSDMWCLFQNAFQAKIASEILHIDFCDYCSSPLGLAKIARSIFDQHSPISLTYSQFREEFLTQCSCGQKTPS